MKAYPCICLAYPVRPSCLQILTLRVSEQSCGQHLALEVWTGRTSHAMCACLPVGMIDQVARLQMRRNKW
jgi:hypothetical protein